MFNTLSYVKMLEEAGVSREQAEAHIEILVEVMTDKLASKEDITDLKLASKQDFESARIASKQDFESVRQEAQLYRSEIKQEAELFRVETKQEFASVRHSMIEMESRLTIKLGIMMMTCVTILGAILKIH